MVIFHSYVSLPEGMADFIAITHPYLNSETLYEPTTFHTIRSRFAADSQPGVLPQVLRQERQVSGYSAL